MCPGAVALVRLTAGVSRELRKGTLNIPLSADMEQPLLLLEKIDDARVSVQNRTAIRKGRMNGFAHRSCFCGALQTGNVLNGCEDHIDR